jgi:hypothetical protein
LIRRERSRAQHTKSARPADGRDNIPAVTESYKWKIDFEHFAD